MLTGQPIEDQAVKAIELLTAVAPADVGATLPAPGDVPAVASKPGELGGRFPTVAAARRRAKAADLEYLSGGIAMPVRVGAIDDNPLLGLGDEMPALRTAQPVAMPALGITDAELLCRRQRET